MFQHWTFAGLLCSLPYILLPNIKLLLWHFDQTHYLCRLWAPPTSYWSCLWVTWVEKCLQPLKEEEIITYLYCNVLWDVGIAMYSTTHPPPLLQWNLWSLDSVMKDLRGVRIMTPLYSPERDYEDQRAWALPQQVLLSKALQHQCAVYVHTCVENTSALTSWRTVTAQVSSHSFHREPE